MAPRRAAAHASAPPSPPAPLPRGAGERGEFARAPTRSHRTWGLGVRAGGLCDFPAANSFAPAELAPPFHRRLSRFSTPALTHSRTHALTHFPFARSRARAIFPPPQPGCGRTLKSSVKPPMKDYSHSAGLRMGTLAVHAGQSPEP